MKKILAILTLGHGMVHWFVGTFWVVLPLLASELRLSFAQVGLLISARSLATALTNLPAGAATDILRRGRLIMGVTLAWLGIAYFGVGLANSLWVVILGLIVVGIGGGLWHPPAMTILSERFPGRRGFALSVHGAGANAGDGLAPIAVGLLLAFLTWRQVLFVNALPGIMVGVIVFLAVSDGGAVAGQRKSLGEYLRHVKALFKNRSFLSVAAVSALRSMSQNAFLTFLPLYLARQFEMSSAVVGFHVALVTISGVVSSPLLGILSDRLGRKPILVCGLFIITAFILTLASLPMGPQFTIAVAILGLFFYSLQGVLFATAMDVAGQEVGATTVGMVFTGNLILSSISPFLAGTIADARGLASTFYFSGAITLLAALLVTIVPLKRTLSAPSSERTTT
ncbi:MAG: MFS transporter [Chloroflexota bacterium]